LLKQYEIFAKINIELSTKIEQLEASATTNACTINDEQLVKKNKKLKENLASSQDAYKSLLAKMKTICKYCDELINKVANLEATKAPKKKSSIFDMPKKDASTSCNDLCLDSPLCNQVCVEKVDVDTCTQEVAIENEQLQQEVARLTKDLTQVKHKTEQALHHQDNTVKRVKKLDEGQTVVCYVCHKEGHKSYECKVKMVVELRRKRKTKRKQASSSTPTPTRWTKRPLHLIS
jgi:FtsZ-binding cell division protein ZapB